MKSFIGKFLVRFQILVVFLFVLGIGHSQSTYFSEADVLGDTTHIVGVEPGFTLWGLWNDYSSDQVCSWIDFRQTAADLNPTLAIHNFTQIPVGATVFVPTACVNFLAIEYSEPEQVVAVSEGQVQQVVITISSELESLLERFVETPLSLSSHDDLPTSTEGPVETQGETEIFDWWRIIIAWGYWFYVALTFFMLFMLFFVLWTKEKSNKDPDSNPEESKVTQGQGEADDTSPVDRLGDLEELVLVLQAEKETLRSENKKLISQRNSANSRYGATLRKLEMYETELSEEVRVGESIVSTESRSRKPRGGRRQKRSIKSQKKTEKDSSSTE